MKFELILRDGAIIAIEATALASRDAFEAFTDHLFQLAEMVWPTPEADDQGGDAPQVKIEPACAVGYVDPTVVDEAMREIILRDAVRAAPPPLGVDALAKIAPDRGGVPGGDLTALRGAERRAKMLALREAGRSYADIALLFKTTQGAVSVAISTARSERAPK